MSYTITKANKQQIGPVLELMLDGISSDPTSVAALGKSWWQRMIFRHLIGPRMLRNQMVTFIAERDGRVVGYLVIQFEGETAGTFDWAVTDPLDGEGIDILGDLIEAALDDVEARGQYPLAYFGMQSSTDSRVAKLLGEMGFWLADYQMGQLRGPLPLAGATEMPDGIAIKPQISLRFGGRLAEFVRMDFDLPDEAEAAEGGAAPAEEANEQGLSLAAQIDAICTLHESTLRASKIYLVEEEGEAVGVIQQFNWKNELRLLLALEPFLWGTETEQRLVGAMPAFLNKQDGYLRVRTFSSDHMQTSRESLAALGLTYEEAPWQRWIVGL